MKAHIGVDAASGRDEATYTGKLKEK